MVVRVVVRVVARVVLAVAAVALPLLASSALAPVLAQQEPPHTLGDCGGAMTGYDGKQYSCDQDRRPACEPDGQRCRCIERLNCGGKLDEPF